MSETEHYTILSAWNIAIENETDIVEARKFGRNIAAKLGFNAVDCSKIATAISELSRNLLIYAIQGTIYVNHIQQTVGTSLHGIQIVSKDKGPGIEDIDLALQDHYSSKNNLGMGLPGTKRIMDEFDIQSEKNKGTTIQIIKWCYDI